MEVQDTAAVSYKKIITYQGYSFVNLFILHSSNYFYNDDSPYTELD